MMGGSDIKKPDCVSLHQDGLGVFLASSVWKWKKKPSLTVRTNSGEDPTQLFLLKFLSMSLGSPCSFSMPQALNNQISFCFFFLLPCLPLWSWGSQPHRDAEILFY